MLLFDIFNVVQALILSVILSLVERNPECCFKGAYKMLMSDIHLFA